MVTYPSTNLPPCRAIFVTVKVDLPMTHNLNNRQIRSMSPCVHFPCRDGRQHWIASLWGCSFRYRALVTYIHTHTEKSFVTISPALSSQQWTEGKVCSTYSSRIFVLDWSEHERWRFPVCCSRSTAETLTAGTNHSASLATTALKPRSWFYRYAQWKSLFTIKW